MTNVPLMDRLRIAKNIIMGREKPVINEKGQPYVYGAMIGRGRATVQLNCAKLYEIYEANTDIKACVREWRENVGAAGYTIRDRKTLEQLPKLQDDISSILNYTRRGEVMVWENLKSNTWRDLGVCDNAFWYLVRNIAKTKVLGVERLDPRTMSIVADEHGNIFAYIQNVGSGNGIVFDPLEIIHFKTDVNTRNELYGESPILSLMWDALGDIEAAKSNYNFFLNDARPVTVFILEDSLTEEKRKAAIEQIRTQFKGSGNQGRGSVMQGVKEVKTFDVSRKDMQYLEGRQFSAKKCSKAYGVPLFLLGETDTVNNNNGIELKGDFYKGTILSKDILFGKQLTVGLLWRMGAENAEMVFNPQIFNSEEIRKSAAEEHENGKITLRQYYEKTSQIAPPEVENHPMFDQLIWKQGSSAILAEDIGVDPMQPEVTPEEINQLQELAKV